MSDPTSADDPDLAVAAPVAAPLDLAVARARTEAALFGTAEAVKIGRYRIIERAGAGGMGVVWSAWDPELSRGVALKLASAGDAAARARARDEGRALGRLSHPNVVPIYDVLEHADGIFLVMELVKGDTLREAARTQTAPQIVRSYRQAGDGLAAAHRAGLVHRDFKPDNAILGADGRVRVLDFGLAHEIERGDAAAIAGTPRYMAPEQRSGAPLTAAVDQYALCVALRESLASRGAVPRWLVPIVARGSAERPADRFPSMDALVHALTLDPATRWRRRALVVVGAIAAAAVVGAFTLGRARQVESPCEGGAAMLAPSWSAERKRLLTDRLAGLAAPYAVDATPRLVSALDGYASGWVRIHRAGCRAHRRGEISSALMDRRTACLSRRHAALAAVSDVASGVTIDALPDLVVAVGELPDLSACDDDDALLSPVAPPSAAQAAEAAAVADALARVDVERDAGRTVEATRAAAAALARAQALGYRPLVARAHLARGRVGLTSSTDDRGAPDFDAAARLALAVGDDPLAIEAYARHVFAAGTTSDAARATDGLPLVEAIADRAGDRARFARALLHFNVGGVALARGDRGTARLMLDRARREAMAVGGSGALELTGILYSLVLVVDDPGERRRLGDELIALRTRLVGAHHPRTLAARLLAAGTLDDAAAVRAAMAPICRDLARYHPQGGYDLGECGYELTALAVAADDRAGAVEAADLVAAAAAHGAEPVQVAIVAAYRQLATGDVAGARAGFAAVLDDHAAPVQWYQKLTVADAALGAAAAALAAGDRGAARALLARATGYFTDIAAAVPPPILARRRAVASALAARAD